MQESVLLFKTKIKVWRAVNQSVYELPNSGGIGTYWFTIFGTVFLTLAAAYVPNNNNSNSSSPPVPSSHPSAAAGLSHPNHYYNQT